jgi:hypothetical protein
MYVQKAYIIFVFIGIVAAASLSFPADAQTNAPGKSLPDLSEAGVSEQVYTVGKFVLEYGPQGSTPHPGLPSLTNLSATEITLARTNDILTRPAGGLPISTNPLAELPNPMRISADGIRTIEVALVRALNRCGLYGVWVTPSSRDIHPRTGEDLRKDRTDLTLIVYTAEIVQLRTIAKGSRIPLKDAINNPVHRRIAEYSPLQPPQGGTNGSLFYKQLLDDYLSRLNRFPGRNVDAAISGSERPGEVVLDYLVNEDKPWVAYAQLSNTGTYVSGPWRERFGFIDQQLTSRDDILTLDYITAAFRYSHALFGSYDVPLIFPDRLKLKIYGSYTQYTADELGITDESITGNSGAGGADLTCTPLTFPGGEFHGLLISKVFVDLTLGAEWEDVEVNNETFGVDTRTDLALPYASLSISSVSQMVKIAGGVQVEGNLAGLAGTANADLADLGRLDPSPSWVLTKWGAGVSFFLEPLFASKTTTLANEFAIYSQGQYTFDDYRLIPQQEALIGGFYSVRGYPEALDAGDTVYTGTAEYRFYMARAMSGGAGENLGIGAKTSQHSQFGNPFHFPAKDAYGRPNWDLILRAFLDGGQSFNHNIQPGESNRNLLGTGVGAELELRRNLDIRLDYGVALLSAVANLPHPVYAGNSRLYFSITGAW